MYCRANQKLQETARLNFVNILQRRLRLISAAAFVFVLLFSTVWNIKAAAVIFSFFSLLFFILSDNMLCIVQHEAHLTKSKILKDGQAYTFTIIKDIFFVFCMILIYAVLHAV